MNHIKLQMQQTAKVTLSDTNCWESFFHDSVIHRQKIYSILKIFLCICDQMKHINVSQEPVLKRVEYKSTSLSRLSERFTLKTVN